jgi:hypothetical protein
MLARMGRLEIKPDQHAALVDGRPLSLTVRELQLLVTLSEHPQRIMTRDELFAHVWGGEPRRDDRSVDVYVSRLRAKLGEALPGAQLITPTTASATGSPRTPDVLLGAFTSFSHARHSRVTRFGVAAARVAAL